MTATSNHQIITTIMDTLLDPEDRRITSWIDQLCRRNQECQPNNVTGFLHAGVYYKPSHIQVQPDVEKRLLHDSLYDEMDMLLRDKAQVDLDRSLIKQSLFALLYPCQTPQDVRDALPDCIASVVPAVGHTPRSGEALWSIQDNERAQRQYAKIEPRLEMYVAARIMY